MDNTKLQHHHDMKMSDPRHQEVFIRMSSERCLFINEDVTKEMASQLSAMLFYFNSRSTQEEVKLYIHTRGGDVSALMQIYDVMNMVDCPISTICLGKAYSAGAVILGAGAKGRRFAMKNSRIMIHGVQAAFPILGHDQDNTKLTFDFLKKTNKSVLEILAKHTGKTYDQIDKDSKRDFYMNAFQAKTYNIIDAVI